MYIWIMMNVKAKDTVHAQYYKQESLALQHYGKILRKIRRYFRKTPVEKDSFQEFLDLNFENYRFITQEHSITFKGSYRGQEFSLRYGRDVQVGTIWLDLEFLIVTMNGEILESKIKR